MTFFCALLSSAPEFGELSCKLTCMRSLVVAVRRGSVGLIGVLAVQSLRLLSSMSCKRINWCPGWESNLLGGMIRGQLIDLRNGQKEKKRQNTEVRYTAGTRNDVEE